MSKKQTTTQPKKQQDESTSKVSAFYRKKCEFCGIQPHPLLKQKIQEVVESNKKLEEIHVWQELGPMQIRSLMEGLCDLDYQHLIDIKIWKANVADEGLRAMCKYIDKCNTIQVLDLLDNRITALGCQFLGKTLTSHDCKIQKLKLDDNPIGTQGLKHLTLGLAKNPIIHKLSFKYCNIDKNGARYIQEILANIKTKIRILKLQGNPLGNQGAYQVLRAIHISGDTLQKINLADINMDLLQYKDPRIDPQIYKPSPRKLKPNSQKPNLFSILQQDPESVVQQQQQGQILKRISLVSLQPPQPSTLTTLQQKVVYELQKILRQNTTISKLNINFNPISNDAGRLIVDLVEYNKKIKEIQLPNSVSHGIREELDGILRKRGGKGKEKGGKAKKKKNNK